MRALISFFFVLLIAGCSTVGDTAYEESVAQDSSATEDPIAKAVLDKLEAQYDTDYVDQLSLPTVAAPVVTGVSMQTNAPIGRNTQDSVNPPKGASVQSNLGFFPSLSLGVTKHTNPSRSSSDDNEDDLSYVIVPTLKYRGAIKNRHIYELGASASSESFQDFEALDGTNIKYSGALRVDMTEKLKADLYASHADSSDPRGSTATRIIGSDIENDEYSEDAFGGRLTIGRRTNPVQIVVGASANQLDFTSNDQDQRDREDLGVSAGLYLNLSAKTSVFVNVSETDIDYRQATSTPFDSTNRQVSIGVGWEPTYTTSLLLQAGEIEKKFDTLAFPDQSADSYLAKLTWLPTEFTSVNFYGSRNFEETTVRSSPVTVSDVFGINLSHAFTESFRGSAFVNWIDDELVGVRQDDVIDYGLGVFYDFNRNLSVGLSWARTERESTNPAAEYNSESLSLTATIKPRRANDFGEPEIQTSEDLRSAE